MRFKSTAGTVAHKRASTKCNTNHINMFLDDFVLGNFNTTEAEKGYIMEAITKANKFGSNKHYEEAYQHLINTFVSQIKYSLTSLQPCVNFKEDNKLIRELIIALFNIKDAEINEKEDEMISRCMAYLESNKVLKTPIKYNIKNPQSYHHANCQK